ncbi:hypothetical protein BpOF4_07315 [Alkalihalophilus pseudofirmus OF4]|uniref:Uncharacterized protein n=1 Tax=Alkalihalophilus pseudofirmus (strain ATCC BAA-2126 / JCM 17055 / OF4) TaxID=398511 RepID=D3FPW1_ALKPO|nr:hypothetical protein BpOF4_07315 [Alkalihalophilus pseudofirmus OF4]
MAIIDIRSDNSKGVKIVSITAGQTRISLKFLVRVFLLNTR